MINLTCISNQRYMHYTCAVPPCGRCGRGWCAVPLRGVSSFTYAPVPHITFYPGGIMRPDAIATMPTDRRAAANLDRTHARALPN